MSNGDATQGDAMTPQEFAKLMGAYPQPAENPLPAYGGYMDNSPANFAWVNNNDYFGAEGEKKNCGCGKDPCITYGAETKMQDGVYKTTCDCGTVMTWDEVFVAKDKDGNRIFKLGEPPKKKKSGSGKTNLPGTVEEVKSAFEKYLKANPDG